MLTVRRGMAPRLQVTIGGETGDVANFAQIPATEIVSPVVEERASVHHGALTIER